MDIAAMNPAHHNSQDVKRNKQKTNNRLLGRKIIRSTQASPCPNIRANSKGNPKE
jgi:hypothetical protein